MKETARKLADIAKLTDPPKPVDAAKLAETAKLADAVQQTNLSKVVEAETKSDSTERNRRRNDGAALRSMPAPLTPSVLPDEMEGAKAAAANRTSRSLFESAATPLDTAELDTAELDTETNGSTSTEAATRGTAATDIPPADSPKTGAAKAESVRSKLAKNELATTQPDSSKLDSSKLDSSKSGSAVSAAVSRVEAANLAKSDRSTTTPDAAKPGTPATSRTGVDALKPLDASLEQRTPGANKSDVSKTAGASATRSAIARSAAKPENNKPDSIKPHSAKPTNAASDGAKSDTIPSRSTEIIEPRSSRRALALVGAACALGGAFVVGLLIGNQSGGSSDGETASVTTVVTTTSELAMTDEPETIAGPSQDELDAALLRVTELEANEESIAADLETARADAETAQAEAANLAEHNELLQSWFTSQVISRSQGLWDNEVVRGCSLESAPSIDDLRYTRNLEVIGTPADLLAAVEACRAAG